MPKFVITLFIVLFFLCISDNYVFAGDRNDEINKVLYSAEHYFTSLRDGAYQSAWSNLSEKSRRSIIDDVYSASKQDGVTITREEIMQNFAAGGIIFLSYWKAVRNTFDPDMVLEKSSWKMGTLQNNRADILIQYKDAPQPTTLKMFKEQHEWRVGFIETFDSLKARKLPQSIYDRFN